MKIRTGTYQQQISFGVLIVNFHNAYKALILDLGVWYVEFIFKDYE